jgi:hypothetical protein
MSHALSDAQALAALRSGDVGGLAAAVAAFAGHLMQQGGAHIAAPMGASAVAALGNSPKAGLLAAGLELRALLSESPQGREFLRDLGFEPLLEQVERE